jgi:hypothetical protein
MAAAELLDRTAYSCILLVPGGLGGRKLQTGYMETWDRLSAELPKIIPYAAEKKVILTPEEVGNKFLVSPRDMRDFIDVFHSPYLQAHFDVSQADEQSGSISTARLKSGKAALAPMLLAALNPDGSTVRGADSNEDCLPGVALDGSIYSDHDR